MNDKNPDNIDEATIIVSGNSIDDATVIVSKNAIDDATVIVSKNVVDDATIIVNKNVVDDATVIVSKKLIEEELSAPVEDLDERTIVVGGLSSLEEATITTSGHLDESTTTAPTGHSANAGMPISTNSFETLPPSTRPITTVTPIVEEEDAVLQIESYQDPDEVNAALKVTKVKPESDELVERLGVRRDAPTPSNNRMHEAAQRLKAMEKKPAKSQGKIAIAAAVIGAVAIGGLVAIVLLKG